MVAFTDFQNILPDPNNPIAEAGQAGGDGTQNSQPVGTAGPGFATVSLASRQPMMKDRTNSGRLLARAVSYHKWEIKISYNPMTRAQFEPVYNFLAEKRGSLTPFFVSLPQYLTSQNTSFVSWTNANAANLLEAAGTNDPGATSVLVTNSGYNRTTNGTPSPGDLFNIKGSNSNHLKTYRVTRVEGANYRTADSSPGGNTHIRVHFVPGLAKSLTQTTDKLHFKNPLVKVIQTGDVQEYNLNTSGLYQFNLSLEEVQ